MAEETDLSRTEAPSAQRLQAARRAGDVPRSAELAGWLVILAALGTLNWLGPPLFDSPPNLMQAAFETVARPAPTGLSIPLSDALAATLWAVLPVLALVFMAVLLAPMALSGWVYAPQAAEVDFSRAHPLRAVARLFSSDALFGGGLTVLKLALLAGAVSWVLVDGWRNGGMPVQAAPLEAWGQAIAWLGRGLFALAGALALAAVLDAGWRWWRYLRRHAMTWQEVLAEARESEVSPELRARIRARQQQAGRREATAGHGIDEVIG